MKNKEKKQVNACLPIKGHIEYYLVRTILTKLNSKISTNFEKTRWFRAIHLATEDARWRLEFNVALRIIKIFENSIPLEQWQCSRNLIVTWLDTNFKRAGRSRTCYRRPVVTIHHRCNTSSSVGTKVVTTMLGFVHMYTIRRSCPPVDQRPSHQHGFGHNFDDGVAIKISLGGLKNTGFVCIHIYTYISTCLFINVLIFKIAHSGLGLANSWS